MPNDMPQAFDLVNVRKDGPAPSDLDKRFSVKLIVEEPPLIVNLNSLHTLAACFSQLLSADANKLYLFNLNVI